MNYFLRGLISQPSHTGVRSSACVFSRRGRGRKKHLMPHYQPLHFWLIFVTSASSSIPFVSYTSFPKNVMKGAPLLSSTWLSWLRVSNPRSPGWNHWSLLPSGLHHLPKEFPSDYMQLISGVRVKHLYSSPLSASFPHLVRLARLTNWVMAFSSILWSP